MTSIVIAVISASLLTAFFFIISGRRRIPDLYPELDHVLDIETALPQIAGLTGGAVLEGNQAVLHQDGRLLGAMMDKINAAQHTVHLESYIWASGKAEAEFVALLCRKAEEGVAVRLLLDAMGAKQADKKRIKKLRDCGVEVAHYHPLSRFSIRRFNNRTHRKLLIVDGQVGFTFGHGIRDSWLGQAHDKDHWRDTGIELFGPVVCPLQTIFTQDWIEATKTPPMEQGCFLKAEDHGPVTAHIVTSSALRGPSSVALLYMLAIASAKREVIIQNPYFAPGPTVSALLERMVSKGVNVRLMLPGRYSDSVVVQRAGQRLYGRLLRAGVDIYLYEKTFLHQKIVIVDDLWSHIGSTNFDARSLALNAEIGIGLLDVGVAGQLRDAFERDLKHCQKLTLERWESRPWYQRLLDWGAYQLHSQI